MYFCILEEEKHSSCYNAIADTNNIISFLNFLASSFFSIYYYLDSENCQYCGLHLHPYTEYILTFTTEAHIFPKCISLTKCLLFIIKCAFNKKP